MPKLSRQQWMGKPGGAAGLIAFAIWGFPYLFSRSELGGSMATLGPKADDPASHVHQAAMPALPI